ncbi:MAG: hypothetical protein PSU94_00260, partial [Lacunisphaera sp.]|nr:hypothetical protein [Lacunisphaera sp.]
FLNQDPIAEQGGLNLYGFCGNNGVNRWDYLGLEFGDTHADDPRIPEGFYDVGDGEMSVPFGYSYDSQTGLAYEDPNAPKEPRALTTSNGTTTNPLTLTFSGDALSDYYGSNATVGGFLDDLNSGNIQVAPNKAGGNALGSTLNALWRAGGALVNATTTTANALATAGRAVVNNAPVMGTNLNAAEFAQAVAQGGTYGFSNNVSLGGSFTYAAPKLGFISGATYGEASLNIAGEFKRDGGTAFVIAPYTPFSGSGGLQFTFPVNGGDTFGRLSLTGGDGYGGGLDLNFNRNGQLSSIDLTVGGGFGGSLTGSFPFLKLAPPPKEGPPKG